MKADASPITKPSNNARARTRDRTILWLLERHPATAGMLAGIGLFPSTKKASKRLGRLLHRGEVRRLGVVSLKDGRPAHVYGRGRWKTDNLLHEVQLTRACLKIDAGEVRRGPRDVDTFLQPDAELWINGQRYLLEMDCGTMSLPNVVQTRFAKYIGCADFVLWICPDRNRMEALRGSATMIRGIALFTVLEWALQDPHERIWIDVDGERAALPRTKGMEQNVGENDGKTPSDEVEEKGGTFSPTACGVPTTTLQGLE